MDRLTPDERSKNMRAIHSKNTKPELCVRKILRSLGYAGYRLHRNDIPGKPDIAFVGRKKVIMVHGCFWHGHQCQAGSRLPKSNLQFWEDKITKNIARDINTQQQLKDKGWQLLEIWECEIKNVNLPDIIDTFMKQP